EHRLPRRRGYGVTDVRLQRDRIGHAGLEVELTHLAELRNVLPRHLDALRDGSIALLRRGRSCGGCSRHDSQKNSFHLPVGLSFMYPNRSQFSARTARPPAVPKSPPPGPARYVQTRLQGRYARLRLVHHAVRRIGIAVHHALVGRPRLERIARLGIDVAEDEERLAEPVRMGRILVGKGIYELLDTRIVALRTRCCDDAVRALGPLRRGNVV